MRLINKLIMRCDITQSFTTIFSLSFSYDFFIRCVPRLITYRKKLTLSLELKWWSRELTGGNASRYLSSVMRENKSYLNESNTRGGRRREKKKKNGTCVVLGCYASVYPLKKSFRHPVHSHARRSLPSARLPVCCQLSVSFLHRRFALVSLPRARPPLRRRQYSGSRNVLWSFTVCNKKKKKKEN